MQLQSQKLGCGFKKRAWLLEIRVHFNLFIVVDLLENTCKINNIIDN